MKCVNCAAELLQGAQFCVECGTKQPSVQQNAQISASPERSIGFGTAVKLYFKNFTNFSGRSSRAEWWWVFLFNIIVGIAVNFLETLVLFVPKLPLVIGWGYSLYSFIMIIPGLALTVRRMHDVGKSGMYLFMGLIPIAGAIILLVKYFQSSSGPNQWGIGPNCWVEERKKSTFSQINKPQKKNDADDFPIPGLENSSDNVQEVEQVNPAAKNTNAQLVNADFGATTVLSRQTEQGATTVLSAISNVGATTVLSNVTSRVDKDQALRTMVQSHAPQNTSDPNAKNMMDQAVKRIIPLYMPNTSLATIATQHSPQTIKNNINAADTDTLIIVLKALNYYVQRGEDAEILGLLEDQVIAVLKSRF